jgi:glycosyltransferase involved in cell wall biosynthesis
MEPMPDAPEPALDLTILMPCLNEAETIAVCVEKAMRSVQTLGVAGEVVIADNGSTDGSQEIATKLGARVVPVKSRGYGSALRGGIEGARGKWIIMGDADDSYDFSKLEPFVGKLKGGAELVMGCRMPRGGGTIMPGAMPPLHRWLGNPVLSWIGRLFFNCPVKDFHCGLRGFSRQSVLRLGLRTTGMEFASEMVIKATLYGQRIDEVPITLHKDGRSRPPHLRSFRDGWRHLRFMLLYSPRWIFLYPGLLLVVAGILAMLWLVPAPRAVGGVVLDVHTLLYAAMATLIGFQAVAFAMFSKVFAMGAGLLPEDESLNRWFRYIRLESGLILGALMMLGGLAASLYAVGAWGRVEFGPLDPSQTLRTVIPAALTLVLGCELVLTSLFLSVLGLRHEGSVLK